MVPMVLSIDDDRAFQMLMRAYLEDEGFCRQFVGCNSAESAEEFLHSIAGDKPSRFPQVIFLDIQMPGMSGWELADVITPLFKDEGVLPAIIMLSATNTTEDKERAAAHPMILDISTKPISNEMLARVRDYSRIRHYFEAPDSCALAGQ